MKQSNLSQQQRDELGLVPKLTRDDVRRAAQNAAAIINRAARDAKKIPEGYESADALLLKLHERTKSHPRGLAGVAQELRTVRKNVWRWLHQSRIPTEDTMRRIAEVVKWPLPEPFCPQIQPNIPIPPRAYGGGRKGKWRTALEKLQIGDSFLCPYLSVPGIRSAATALGIEIEARSEGLKFQRVWRVK